MRPQALPRPSLHQDPPVPQGEVTAVPLVNNRKGSLLPPGVGLGPHGGFRISTSGSGRGDTAGRALAEQSRLSRARSLPVKYCYHPSNASLHGHSSRACRLTPLAGCISPCQSLTPCTVLYCHPASVACLHAGFTELLLVVKPTTAGTTASALHEGSSHTLTNATPSAVCVWLLCSRTSGCVWRVIGTWCSDRTPSH